MFLGAQVGTEALHGGQTVFPGAQLGTGALRCLQGAGGTMLVVKVVVRA